MSRYFNHELVNKYIEIIIPFPSGEQDDYFLDNYPNISIQYSNSCNIRHLLLLLIIIQHLQKRDDGRDDHAESRTS